ncbi:MAG: DinB family protein [Dehalococcoidia bacterium]
MSEIANYRQELTARLRLITEDLGWAVRPLTVERLAYKPTQDDWSIHEHLAHLRDMEQEVYLPLLRWATVPEMLDPKDYSRRDWHEHRYRPSEPLALVLNDFTRMRDEALLVFRDMDNATWTRWRDDTRWGPITCQWIAELMYRHALDHLQGIMALRQDINLEACRPPAIAGGTESTIRRAP